MRLQPDTMPIQEQTPRGVSVPAEVRMTEVDGEAVLLNLATGRYFSLDPVGTRMWTLLAQHGRVEPAVGALLDEYDVGEAELRRDLDDLIRQLAAHGLLRVEGE